MDVVSATDKILNTIDRNLNKVKRTQGDYNKQTIDALTDIRDTVFAIKRQAEEVKKKGWY